MPVYSTSAVAAKTVYAVAQDRVILVGRSDVTLEVSREVLFTSDRVAVRAKARYGLAWPTPTAEQDQPHLIRPGVNHPGRRTAPTWEQWPAAAAHSSRDPAGDQRPHQDRPAPTGCGPVVHLTA